MQDTGAVLGYYGRNVLATEGAEPLEAYLPRLLDQLDVLRDACRAVGAEFKQYNGFPRQLLAQPTVTLVK